MDRSVHVSRRVSRGGAEIAEIRLARPRRGNALDEVMLGEIAEAAADLARDPALRAVLLTGEGRHFCAGADLNWMRRGACMAEADNLRDARHLVTALRGLSALPMPVIAVAQGCTYGGGLGLLACADMVLAEEAATFRFSEPCLGLVPAVIGPFVVRAIGVRRARGRFLAAEAFGARAALADGLVHEVVAADALPERVEALLASVAACGPEALRGCKSLLGQLQEHDGLSEEAESTCRLIARLRVGAEAQEGMAAFLAKRRPAWIPAVGEAA
ncbi:methylglutaconyl-CoA hydratase [Methylorubrum rhodinum]|uniref:Methylglutaconyl-CoA hydratase n=1 Tax=Methylorubrum rhodinum TaxID=29428 RepID=A0A840ZIC7_9HYPH|nr:enoyl-CoA hydratase-related protein [Methylorubrum rhodinum]MBB5757326.1 methylglutaconyl-CoA hydratase [Methylorubrum rhodinum]